MNIRASARILAAILASVTAASGASAATYEIKDGKLVAIRGIYGHPVASDFADANRLGNRAIFVTPDGTFERLSDVEFVDGTCLDIFGKCRSMDGFSPRPIRVLNNFIDLMKDGVKINGKIYDFASSPSLINGCESTVSCAVIVGSRYADFDKVDAIKHIINAVGGNSSVDVPKSDATVDTRTLSGTTFARYTSYTKLVTTVPEPATWAMMLLGFGTIGGAARYRRKSRTVSFV